MTTAIPPTIFTQIVQTKSSPEITAALLNEAENTYSSTPRHSNSKRVYPFWKTCAVCSNPFPCQTKEQATRNLYCSPDCVRKMLSAPRTRKPMEDRPGMAQMSCAVCGLEVWKPRAWLARAESPVCSRQCGGVLRGQDWAKHAHKGRASWTAASEESFRQKMSGEKNPAWKGGVMKRRSHGNHAGAIYVRCPAAFLSMARADGYVMEHRLIVAEALGRCLTRSEVVHHKNHQSRDNRRENLQLFASNSDHKLFEARGTPAPIWSG